MVWKTSQVTLFVIQPNSLEPGLRVSPTNNNLFRLTLLFKKPARSDYLQSAAFQPVQILSLKLQSHPYF